MRLSFEALADGVWLSHPNKGGAPRQGLRVNETINAGPRGRSLLTGIFTGNLQENAPVSDFAGRISPAFSVVCAPKSLLGGTGN
jgi:hypothetical protein